MDKYFNLVQKFREHIHANPELSFEEFETAKYIRASLDVIGADYMPIANTGTVVQFGPVQKGKVIGIRADIDALPIKEETDKPYTSKKPGVMHACGHDFHAANALTLCHFLQEHESELQRGVVVFFQPGEEKLPGGASILIKEGLLEKFDFAMIFALHVFPELEAGKIGFKAGEYMASTDEVFVTVKGKGGHGAMPHLAVDSVYAAAQYITQVQHIVSRNSNPIHQSVVSFGRIEGQGATNVLPPEVKLDGTIRTFNEDWRAKVKERLVEIGKGLGIVTGAEIDVNIVHGYPCLVNHPDWTERFKQLGYKSLGEENIVELPLRMTAEDFSFFSHKLPTVFFRVGTASPNGDEYQYGVHHPKFDIHIDAYRTSITYLTDLIREIAII